MRHFLCFLAALLPLLLAGCGQGKSSDNNQVTDTILDSGQIVDTAPAWDDSDTTIYGRADGFGMSAFTLIGDDNREYDVSLTAEDGGSHYGHIYGDRNDTARYAMTTYGAGESLDVLINLSQLEKFTKNYEIHNAHLVLRNGESRDLVDIIELCDTIFRAKGKSGREYVFRR